MQELLNPIQDNECPVFYTRHGGLLEALTEFEAPGSPIRACFEAASNPSLKSVRNRLGVWGACSYSEWKLVLIRNPGIRALFPQNLEVG